MDKGSVWRIGAGWLGLYLVCWFRFLGSFGFVFFKSSRYRRELNGV